MARKQSTEMCKVEDCGRFVHRSGRCATHDERYRKTGVEGGPIRSRKRNGEGGITPQGYKVIYKPGHPNALNKNGSIFEHTFVMSEYLGRPLLPHENVHHKNGVKDDNRLDNLELWSKSQPPGQRVEDKVAWAKEILKLYEPRYLENK